MICANCGKQIDDNAAFCGFCGTAVAFSSKSNQQSKNTRKRLPLIIGVSVIGILIAIAAVLLLIPSKVNKFTELIENHDYQSAKQLYRDLSDSNREKANGWLEGYAEKVVEDFAAEKLDYNSAKEELTNLSAFQALKTVIANDLSQLDATQFEKQIEGKEIDSAVALYQNMSDDARNAANDWLTTFLQKTESDYYEGTIDYTTARDIISNVRNFEAARRDATDILERIYADNEATKAFTNAKEFAEQEKWLQAYQLLENITVDFRNYDDVAKARTEYAGKYKETVINDCDKLLAAGKYKELFSAISEALGEMPNDTELSVKSTEYYNAFEKNSLSEAAALAEAEKYAEAVTCLEDAQSIYYFDSFWDAASEYYYSWLVKTVETTENDSGLENAVAVLNAEKYTSTYFNDKCLSFAETYFTRFVDDVLERASAYAKERKFQKAVEIIEDAGYTYSDDRLQTALDNYSEYLPIDLADCQVIDSERLKVGSFTDAFGNTYDNAIANEKYGAYAHVIYYLNKRFVKLSGTISVVTCELNYNAQPVGHPIYFYKDGELVYTTPTIINNTEPFSFEIDVTGCSQLEIYFSEEEYYWWNWQAVISATLS